MIILKFYTKIDRDEKGKKVYYTHNNKLLKAPILPENWQHMNKSQLKIKDVMSKEINYIIKPSDDYIILDCDSIKATQEVYKFISKDDYVVKSDNNTAHFYFKISKYAKENLPLGKRTRVNNIDILSGNKCFAFTPNKYNKTKYIAQGSLDKIKKIPKDLVNYLSKHLEDRYKNINEYSNKITNTNLLFMADDIDSAMTLYKKALKKGMSKDKAYDKYLWHIFSNITPLSFMNLAPSYHPDKVVDGEGIIYLQALSTKIAQDPTISPSLHKKFITFIATKLWSDPLSKARIKTFLSNLTTQKFSDGSPVFVYDPNITKGLLLISVNNSPKQPVYRTLKDEYVILVDGEIELISSFTNFKRFVVSENVTLTLDNKRIDKLTEKIIANIKTIFLENTPKKQTGLNRDKHKIYYNYAKHTHFMKLLRFNEAKEQTSSVYIDSIDPKTYKINANYKIAFPTITKILKNITYDNYKEDEKSTIVDKLLIFLAKKLTTAEYSPIVFYMSGNRGTGKSSLFYILDRITELTAQTDLRNPRFNSEYEGKLFVIDDEGSTSAMVKNTMKKLSGNPKMRIEKKGVDSYEVENTMTLLLTSNHPYPLAESLDDRRVVSFLSHSADLLKIKNYKYKIDKDIEEFVLFLRDLTKVKNFDKVANELYYNANYWHDEAHRQLYLDAKETLSSNKIEIATNKLDIQENGITDTKSIPRTHEKDFTREDILIDLIEDSDNIDPESVYNILESVFGENFYFTNQRDTLAIFVGKSVKAKKIVIDNKVITNNFISPTYLKNKNKAIAKLYERFTYLTSKHRVNVMLIPRKLIKGLDKYLNFKNEITRNNDVSVKHLCKKSNISDLKDYE